MAQISRDTGALRRTRLAKKPKPVLKKWTDLGLRNLKPPPGRTQWAFRDPEQRGLELLVSPTGTKTFRSHYRVKGRPQWQARSIGRLGENTTHREGNNFSVAAAREQCRADRALAAQGIDPEEHYNSIHEAKKKEEEADAFTVARAIEFYLREHARPTMRTWPYVERRLNAYLVDWLDRPAKDITRKDLEKIRDDLREAGKASSGAAAVMMVKAFWRFLLEAEKVESDPFSNVKRKAVAPKRKAKVYTDADIRAIWRAAGRMPDQECAFVRLILLLAPRRTALAMATWGQLNLRSNVWTTPPDLVKQRQTKEVQGRTYKTPLSMLARVVLNTLTEGLPDDRIFEDIRVYLNDAKRPVVQLDVLRKRLIKAGAPKGFGWHAFRYTITSWLEDEGCDPFDRALVLNHAIGGVTAVYSHGFAMERKRAVLEKWAQHVAKLVGEHVPKPTAICGTSHLLQLDPESRAQLESELTKLIEGDQEGKAE